MTETRNRSSPRLRFSKEELENPELAQKAEKAKKAADRYDAAKKKLQKPDDVDLEQMTLFDAVKDDDIIEELKNIDLGNLTPIEALNTLYKLQNKVKNRWSC